MDVWWVFTLQVFSLSDAQMQSEQPWQLMETLALAGFEPVTRQLFFLQTRKPVDLIQRKKIQTGVELIF